MRQKKRWSWPRYLAWQALFIGCAIGCAASAMAMDGKAVLVSNSWAGHLFLTVLAIVAGTWLGINIPPPKGYEESNNWPKNVKYVAGYSMGIIAALYVGQRASDLDWRIVALTFFVSSVGPAAVVIGRAFVLSWLSARAKV